MVTFTPSSVMELQAEPHPCAADGRAPAVGELLDDAQSPAAGRAGRGGDPHMPMALVGPPDAEGPRPHAHDGGPAGCSRERVISSGGGGAGSAEAASEGPPAS